MATMTGEKHYALEWIDEHARRFSDFLLRIWSYAEPAWREYKSAKAYCELLRLEGFAVEEGSGEMPTAFCARRASISRASTPCGPSATPRRSRRRSPRRGASSSSASASAKPGQARS